MHLSDDSGHMAESSFTGRSKTERLGRSKTERLGISYVCFPNHFFNIIGDTWLLKGEPGT